VTYLTFRVSLISPRRETIAGSDRCDDRDRFGIFGSGSHVIAVMASYPRGVDAFERKPASECRSVIGGIAGTLSV
jgi:hypothetical protein